MRFTSTFFLHLLQLGLFQWWIQTQTSGFVVSAFGITTVTTTTTTTTASIAASNPWRVKNGLTNKGSSQCWFLSMKMTNSDDNNSNMNEDLLQSKFGGYTVKQRLREEIESPFRTVRLVFFGSSTVSALLALYFSLINVLKAATTSTTTTASSMMLSYSLSPASSSPTLQDSLQSTAINGMALALCGFLTWREYQVGQANLARIAKGGALAKLQVQPMTLSSSSSFKNWMTLKDYRRSARVCIAVGGKKYIQTLAQSLNSDSTSSDSSSNNQTLSTASASASATVTASNNNNLPQLLEQVNVIVIPVLLDTLQSVGDSETCWKEAAVATSNVAPPSSINVIAFPRGRAAWWDYLQSEIETAQNQGFDVLNKGFTILVKKNGRILRRATGQPQWSALVETMQVMDGSQFGMPQFVEDLER